MPAEGSKTIASLGFLTVTEHAQLGLLGGYLVLNAKGRPLEFHCTAPIKANRAQEILFGPTLAPYLYGEQIGQTLANRSKVAPPLILTDVEPMLSLRDFVDAPVALVNVKREAVEGGAASAATDLISLESRPLAILRRHAGDVEKVETFLGELGSEFDFNEPFQRIREAIQEAQRAA